MARPEDSMVLTQSGKFTDPDVALETLATPTVAGTVKQAAFVADPAALTSATITGGQSPTEAEHNLLVDDVAALHATLTALMNALQGADKPMAAA